MVKSNRYIEGMSYSEKRTVTESVIEEFARISGDYNPVHMDSEYARSCGFKDRIAHGLFCASMVSEIIGNSLPGEGSIFVKESIIYKAPVYLGDTVEAKVSIVDVNSERGRIKVAFQCCNDRNEKVVVGDADLMMK